ncbi:MAG: T9SS type A sorting domain-containing protein [Bacteroidetes bacterium]|nr:T9SS type A sorting domain-containing protein [Bacteroidota bacterium]
MKKSLLFSLGISLAIISQAQINSPNVIAVGGNYFVAGSFTNSFTIGEMAMVSTASTASFILTQGFQQPADAATGIVESNHLLEFSEYPNPSNGSINLDYSMITAGKVRTEVYNALGQIVFNNLEEKSVGVQHDHLDLSTFANGFYSIRCTILMNDGNYNSFISPITLTK